MQHLPMKTSDKRSECLRYPNSIPTFVCKFRHRIVNQEILLAPFTIILKNRLYAHRQVILSPKLQPHLRMPRRTDAELDESTDSIMFPPTVMSKKNEATKAIEALSGSSEAEIATRANEPEPTFHIDISEIPMYERIVRQVDKANEGYYQVSLPIYGRLHMY